MPTARCRAFARTTSGYSPSSGRWRAPTLADWPFGYDELEPYYAEAETSHRGGRGGRCQSLRRPAERTLPDAARRPDVLRGGHHRRRRTTGLPPLSRAPRRATRSPTTTARPATTAASARIFGCPIHAKGDPVASLRRALMTGTGRAAPRVDGLEDPEWRTAGPPAWSGSTPKESTTSRGPPRGAGGRCHRDARACCSSRGSSTPRSAATSCTTSRPSPSASCPCGSTPTRAAR